MAMMINQILWISLSPIASRTADVFDSTEAWVNTASTLYFVVYIPVNFIANYTLDNYGLRLGINIGAVFTAIGGVVKCFIGYNFYLMLLG